MAPRIVLMSGSVTVRTGESAAAPGSWRAELAISCVTITSGLNDEDIEYYKHTGKLLLASLVAPLTVSRRPFKGEF
jgi:hypothetical protein